MIDGRLDLRQQLRVVPRCERWRRCRPEALGRRSDPYVPGDTGSDVHIAWVTTGSAGVKGKGYGDPNRAGGQHIATSGGMPGFGATLSPEEIDAVVDYERDGL